MFGHPLSWCNFKHVYNKLYHMFDDGGDDEDEDDDDALVFLLNNLKVLYPTENHRSSALPPSTTRWQPQACRSACLRTVLTFLYF